MGRRFDVFRASRVRALRCSDNRAEIEQTGRSNIPSQIMAGIQADQCACDIRNPQGRCCLGNVNRLIDLLMDPSSHAEAQDV